MEWGLITCLNLRFYHGYEMALQRGGWTFLLYDHGCSLEPMLWANSAQLEWSTRRAVLVSEKSCLKWISRGSIRRHIQHRIHPCRLGLMVSPFSNASGTDRTTDIGLCLRLLLPIDKARITHRPYIGKSMPLQ